jgi:hypothetical protein
MSWTNRETFSYYFSQPIHERNNNFYVDDIDSYCYRRYLQNSQNYFYKTSDEIFAEEFVKRFLEKPLTNALEVVIL